MDNTVHQDTPQRQCIRCLIMKPFHDFWQSSKNSDGVEHTCITCRRLIKQKKIAGSMEVAIQGRILSGMKECHTCHHVLPLTAEFFNRSSRHLDGFAYVCRDCRMASRRMPPKPRTIPEGMKKCNECARILPASQEYFQRSSKAPDGFMNKCKECRNPHLVKWNHAKKPLKGPHIKDGMKRCFACKEWFPLTEDYFPTCTSSQFGFKSRCHPCYRKLHSENARKDGNTRRARQKAIQGTFTFEQIEAQLKRQKYKCYYCACKFQKKDGKYIYHIDHTYPLYRVEGTGIPANSIDYLVLACPHCNESKGRKFPWEWPEGGRLM